MISRSRVFTPDPLAEAIVQALAVEDSSDWLEPSCGGGAFVRAIAGAGISPGRITAVEIDQSPECDDAQATVLRGRDFFQWMVRHKDHRFSRIVGNPPYIPFRDIPPGMAMTTAEISAPDGARISRRANYWYFFLCAALQVLEEDGCIGFVLPATFEFADYAASLRSALPERFSRVEVFRSAKPLFPRVSEGSVVLLAFGYGRGPGVVRRTECSDLTTLIAALGKEPGTSLDANPPAGRSGTLLRDLATIRIGAVTGDAEYFLISEATRRKFDLPASACRPTLSRSRHLTSASISRAGWETLRARGERVWLFRPSLTQAAVEAVEDYLNWGRNQGGCTVHAKKVQDRQVWYRVPLPPRVDGFISGTARCGPFLAINNWPELTASNSLYVVSFAQHLSQLERWGVAMGLLSTSAREQVKSRLRWYAGGLRKCEPRDIMDICIPIGRESGSVEARYKEAVQALVLGDERRATEIADAWLNGNTSVHLSGEPPSGSERPERVA